LAVIGLTCLYVVSILPDLPVVPIGEITPTMNFATVRVTGKVIRRPYIGRHNGQIDYLSFPVDDGTGSLRIAAYRHVARALHMEDRIPAQGNNVDVTGNLRISQGGRIVLYLHSAEQLRAGPAHSAAGGQRLLQEKRTAGNVNRGHVVRMDYLM
jgi:hypothetical protein